MARTRPVARSVPSTSSAAAASNPESQIDNNVMASESDRAPAVERICSQSSGRNDNGWGRAVIGNQPSTSSSHHDNNGRRENSRTEDRSSTNSHRGDAAQNHREHLDGRRERYDFGRNDRGGDRRNSDRRSWNNSRCHGDERREHQRSSHYNSRNYDNMNFNYYSNRHGGGYYSSRNHYQAQSGNNYDRHHGDRRLEPPRVQSTSHSGYRDHDQHSYQQMQDSIGGYRDGGYVPQRTQSRDHSRNEYSSHQAAAGYPPQRDLTYPPQRAESRDQCRNPDYDRYSYQQVQRDLTYPPQRVESNQYRNADYDRYSSQQVRRSSHDHDFGGDNKRHRTDHDDRSRCQAEAMQSSNIEQLTRERDIQRLQTETKEAELKAAHAERGILEEKAKIEEARKRLELVRSQSAKTVAPNTNLNDKSDDRQSVPARREERAPPVDSADASRARPVAATTNDNKSHATEASKPDAVDLVNGDSSFSLDDSEADESYKEIPAARSRGAKRQRQQRGRKAKPTKSKKGTTPKPKKKKDGRRAMKTRDPDNVDLATLYTEKNLTSTYTPQIVGHSLVVVKFLLEFSKNGEANSACEQPSEPHLTSSPIQLTASTGASPARTSPSVPSPAHLAPPGPNSQHACQCWVSFEDFVFPALAHEYLSKLIENGSHPDQNEVLTLWRDEFLDREWRMNRENTINALSSEQSESSKEEEEDINEIDFCCFLCKCSLNDSTLKLIQNCPAARKFHRGCCHGYKKPEDLKQFVSKAGQAQEKFFLLGNESGDDETEMPHSENADLVGTKPSAVKIDSINGQVGIANHKSVVLSINTGIGSVAVALAQLKLKTKRIIHAEEDRVARHVIRANHDIKYGEAETDDGTGHVVGLYDSLAELREDPEDFVKRFGPIDLIVSASKGNTDEEHKKFTEDFLAFCSGVRKWNKEIHQHDKLFYLIETLPIDHADTNAHSYCTCDSRVGKGSKRTLICNWPLSAATASLKDIASSESNMDDSKLETFLGLKDEYATKPVTTLFNALKTALLAGPLGQKWCDIVHPKFWNFLAMGPDGYDFKVVPADSDCPLDGLQLEVKEPLNTHRLSDAKYAQHLLRNTMSVRWLSGILRPLTSGGLNVSEAEPVNEENENSQRNTRVEDFECVVCMDARKRVTILPCKHMCLCENCADFTAIKKCPMCNCDVEDSLTSFV